MKGVIEKDKGWNSLKARMKNAKSRHVRVGVMGAKGEKLHEEGRISMVRLAGVHEFGATIEGTAFGTVTIPERSFIRATVDTKRAEISDFIASLVRKLMDGKKGEGTHTVDRLYGLLGEKVTSLMKGRIEDGLQPSLSPVTLKLRRHGGSKPLLDTGALRNSIGWLIVKDEKK